MNTSVFFICLLIPALFAALPVSNNPSPDSDLEDPRACFQDFFESGCLPSEIPDKIPSSEDLQEIYECLIDNDDINEECKDGLEDMKICHDLVEELCGEPSADRDFRECMRSEETREALKEADCKPPRHRGRGGRGGRGNVQTQFTQLFAAPPSQKGSGCRKQIREVCESHEDFPQCALLSDDVDDECKQIIEEKQKCKEIVNSICGEPDDDKASFRKCIRENKDAIDAAGCKPPRRHGNHGNRQKRNVVPQTSDDENEEKVCRQQIKSVCENKEDFPGCALDSDAVDQSCKDQIEEKQKCRDLVDSLCGKPEGKHDQEFRNCMMENKDKLDEAGCKPPRRHHKGKHHKDQN